jgi:hypothetical protein
MPTARNAKGPDVLIYSEDVSRTRTIQVKTVSARTNVMLGKSNGVFGDFLVICLRLSNPVCFVLTTEEVRRLSSRNKKESHFWLDPRDYDTDKFRDNWKRIGSGLKPPIQVVIPEPQAIV